MKPGIPTTYKYTEYRSRLEARWACFFDLLGWKYEYEPYDLNGWIPDFSLLGAEEILVEIKPYSKLEEFNDEKIFSAIRNTEKWGKEILLIGITISDSDSYFYKTASIGWITDFFDYDSILYPDHSNGYTGFAPAIITNYDGYGFCSDLNSYKDRITGIYEGGHVKTADFDDILYLWGKAKNTVKWHKK